MTPKNFQIKVCVYLYIIVFFFFLSQIVVTNYMYSPLGIEVNANGTGGLIINKQPSRRKTLSLISIPWGLVPVFFTRPTHFLFSLQSRMQNINDNYCFQKHITNSLFYDFRTRSVFNLICMYMMVWYWSDVYTSNIYNVCGIHIFILCITFPSDLLLVFYKLSEYW